MANWPCSIVQFVHFIFFRISSHACFVLISCIIVPGVIFILYLFRLKIANENFTATESLQNKLTQFPNPRFPASLAGVPKQPKLLFFVFLHRRPLEIGNFHTWHFGNIPRNWFPVNCQFGAKIQTTICCWRST